MNYTELKAAIPNWTRRTDLGDVIPTFIELAEAEIDRKLNLTYFEARARATLNGEFLPLPADCKSVKSAIILGSEPKVIEYKSSWSLIDQRLVTSQYPSYFTITAGQFRFSPVPTATSTEIEIVYSTFIPPLSNSNLTNKLIELHPDLYLYSTLLHAAPYLKNDDRVLMWQQKKEEMITQLRLQDDELTYGGSPLRIRPRGL